MAFDTLGPLEALIELLGDLDGVRKVYRGVPESVDNRLCAYVALAGQRVGRPTLRVMERKANYFVGLVYRVQGAEATAETTLAETLDALVLALDADRTLGGTAVNIELDLSLADRPEYRDLAGQEYRNYPVMVTVTQHQKQEVQT